MLQVHNDYGGKFHNCRLNDLKNIALSMLRDAILYGDMWMMDCMVASSGPKLHIFETKHLLILMFKHSHFSRNHSDFIG